MTEFKPANTHTTITASEYQALEDAGRIRRPLTDRPIGDASSDRRAASAAASAIFTEPPSPYTDRNGKPEDPRIHNDEIHPRMPRTGVSYPPKPRNGASGRSMTPKTSDGPTAPNPRLCFGSGNWTSRGRCSICGKRFPTHRGWLPDHEPEATR